MVCDKETIKIPSSQKIINMNINGRRGFKVVETLVTSAEIKTA